MSRSEASVAAGRIRMRALRLERHAAGQCEQCGSTPLATKRRCQRCADQLLARERASKEERKAAGLPETMSKARRLSGCCVDCGCLPPLKTTARCAPCATRRRSVARQLVEQRAAAGVPATQYQRWEQSGRCVYCGGDRGLTGELKSCDPCRNQRNAARAAMEPEKNQTRRALGQCLRCTAASVVGTDHCETHTLRLRNGARKRTQTLRARRTSIGQCGSCSDTVWGPELNHCAFHYTKRIIGNYTTTPTDDMVDGILDKFTGACAYTNGPLVPGPGMQLEHIFPKKLYPELMAEPSNLVWISTRMNDGKGDMDPYDPEMERMFLPDVVARIRLLASQVVRPCAAAPTTQNLLP